MGEDGGSPGLAAVARLLVGKRKQVDYGELSHFGIGLF